MDIREDLVKVREEKEQKLKDLGINTRPEKFAYTHTIKEAATLEEGTNNVSIAGRVMSKRKMGKISFMDLRDVEGRIQLCLKKDEVGEENQVVYGHIRGVTDTSFTVGSSETNYPHTIVGLSYAYLAITGFLY